jgi:hypothetical protein
MCQSFLPEDLNENIKRCHWNQPRIHQSKVKTGPSIIMKSVNGDLGWNRNWIHQTVIEDCTETLHQVVQHQNLF